MNKQKQNIIRYAKQRYHFLNQLEVFISIYLISIKTQSLKWLQLFEKFSIDSILKVLLCLILSTLKKVFSYSVSATLFQALIKRWKKNHIKIFAMSVENIDREIVYNTQCKLNALNVVFINASA